MSRTVHECAKCVEEGFFANAWNAPVKNIITRASETHRGHSALAALASYLPSAMYPQSVFKICFTCEIFQRVM